jgi:hypothetical protein
MFAGFAAFTERSVLQYFNFTHITLITQLITQLSAAQVQHSTASGALQAVYVRFMFPSNINTK